LQFTGAVTGYGNPDRKPTAARIELEWTLAHAYVLGMGGMVYPTNDIIYAQEGSSGYRVPNNGILRQMNCRYAAGQQNVHPLGGLVLEECDIEDKSKADWLLKLIAVLQILSLIMTVRLEV
jgi:hypothetical protein